MKGQTAVEYLMTYGWAILIILIVAGVLAYYGIFAPAGFLGPSSKGFTQVSVLQPWDLSSDAVGTFKMQVENRVGQDIIIDNVYAVTGSGAAPLVTDICTLTSPASYTTVTAGTKFPPTGLMTLTCPSIIGGSVGSSYTITVEIDYRVGGATGTLLKQTGTLSGSRS
jgi:hypothetical protein